MDTPSVWERTGESTISANLYAFWITFWTAIGITTSAVAASLALSWEYSLVLVVPATIASIVGILIAHNKDDPLISIGG